MQIHYVSKLFFGKYAYKVVLNTVTGGSRWWRDRVPPEFACLDAWCDTHMKGAHKIQRRYQSQSKKECRWHQIVYVNSETHVQELVTQHVQDVLEIWKPLDQAHLQMLDVKNIVEIRTSLLFKKYRYAVYFKYNRTSELWNWLEDQFSQSETSKLMGDMWWPKVYSVDELDVTMLRLSFPDVIDYVKTVRLVTD